MKTIEERATDYACDDGVMPDSYDCESCFNIYGKCTRDAYIAGANSEHKELTRWHDPTVELPEDAKTVLVKYVVPGESSTYYTTGFYLNGGRVMPSGWMTAVKVISGVIGWREIHE